MIVISDDYETTSDDYAPARLIEQARPVSSSVGRFARHHDDRFLSIIGSDDAVVYGWMQPSPSFQTGISYPIVDDRATGKRRREWLIDGTRWEDGAEPGDRGISKTPNGTSFIESRRRTRQAARRAWRSWAVHTVQDSETRWITRSREAIRRWCRACGLQPALLLTNV